MLRVRWFAAMSAALLVSAVQSPALAATCAEPTDLTVLPSPASPWTGAPLRVMVVSEEPVDGALSLVAPDGSIAAAAPDRRGSEPYFWFAEVAKPVAGKWQATLAASAGCNPVTREITVEARKPAGISAPAGKIWQVRANWNSTTEALFSAWVEKLFDGPPDQDLSWKVWSEVLRDQSRNFLFNYLGRNEDHVATGKPDCADFVYFLRAYFAYKMGLPFGYSNCSRGMGGRPPKCYQWFDIDHPEVTRPPPPPEQQDVNAAAAPTAPPPPEPPKLLGIFRTQPPPDAQPATPPVSQTPAKPKPQPPKRPTNFAEYLRDVGDVVHTGAVRVVGADDNTDFYTVPLTRKALHPGTVYADPYGHVLMLVHLVPEADGKPGVYLAVDAEPDGSITRKRFWRGNFLFAHDPALGTSGFKHFRPIVGEKSGPLRRLTNAEIAKNPQYGDFSAEQSQMNAEDFYDKMDDVMSPDPLDPVKAMTDAIASLYEQVKVRVTSVENGRKYQEKTPGTVSMPDGPSIFETTGAWEDYSTPARDFRLLIAIDVVRNFPERFARRSDRYAIPAGKTVDGVRRELQGVLDSELAQRKLSYTRSDGSQWTLTLKQVLDRAAQFEMAYNPNDCAELRWGASDNTDEIATCKRHAPQAQRDKMSSAYRGWFRERHWPTHGQS
jgi:hypothetical protein